MHCTDISVQDYEAISAELTNAERRDGAIETVTGMHETLGATLLVRDATRCLVLVADPTVLERSMAERAFVEENTFRPRNAPTRRQS